MRTIAHLSDLHFGRVAEETLSPLREAVAALRPDLVAVSGDLTQRARKREFREARDFLDSLPGPQIVVPGNHDVPLYNVLARWLWPLENYRRHIESSLVPSHADGEVAVLGLSSARSLTVKDGRLNLGQMRGACDFFGRHKGTDMRILVTHHPFDVAERRKERDIMGRADLAMAQFSNCGVDMILTGHMHGAQVFDAAHRYGEDKKMLLVQAGTATSTRTRDEVNSWNVIRICGAEVAVEVMTWQDARKCFVPTRQDRFRRGPAGWERLGSS